MLHCQIALQNGHSHGMLLYGSVQSIISNLAVKALEEVKWCTKPSTQTWHSIQTAGRLLEMETTHFFCKWKQPVSFGIEFLKVIYVYS